MTARTPAGRRSVRNSLHEHVLTLESNVETRNFVAVASDEDMADDENARPVDATKANRCGTVQKKAFSMRKTVLGNAPGAQVAVAAGPTDVAMRATRSHDGERTRRSVK